MDLCLNGIRRLAKEVPQEPAGSPSLAVGYLRKERQGHTLQPTALVHEAYVRLIGEKNPSWQHRKHFYGVAARLMPSIGIEPKESRRIA